MWPFARRADELARALHVDVPAAPAERGSAAPAEQGEYPDHLSGREVEVLIRMARGRTRDEIAGDLILGRATIAGHVRNIFEKINVGDEAGATAYVVEKGLAAEPAGVAGGVGPSLRIILVSDIVASSALIHRSGDAKAHDLMQRHNALLRQCLAAHQGTEVTHTGDGIEASFSTASNAVDCAVDQKGCPAQSRPPTDGFTCDRSQRGEPIAPEGRLFGRPCKRVRHLCARGERADSCVRRSADGRAGGSG